MFGRYPSKLREKDPDLALGKNQIGPRLGAAMDFHHTLRLAMRQQSKTVARVYRTCPSSSSFARRDEFGDFMLSPAFAGVDVIRERLQRTRFSK